MVSIEGLTVKFVLFCIFLGFAGQLFHLGIGMYKKVARRDGIRRGDKFDSVRCLLGLFIGAFVGGLLSLIYSSPLKGTDVIAIMAAGYCGVDFIEAFFERRSSEI
jgi:uncharacterized membrane protein YoaK (UPF0700 family)